MPTWRPGSSTAGHDPAGRGALGRGAGDDHAPRDEPAGDRPRRELIGIVSCRDLLSVFLRPDGEITGDAGYVLDQLPLGDPAGITMTVRHGVVTLTGVIMPRPGQHRDLVRAAIGQIRDVDGVVDVVNRLIDGQGPESGTEVLAGW